MAAAPSEQGARSPWDDAAPLPKHYLFDAVLEPRRSMPRSAFRILMILLLVQSVVRSAIFWAMGAWPCIFFLAVDFAIVYFAFRANYHHARLYERLRLTETELSVERFWPDGRVQRWAFEPYWTRVELESRGEHGCKLTVVSRNRRVVIGAFLSPQERPDIADALKAALARGRQPVR